MAKIEEKYFVLMNSYFNTGFVVGVVKLVDSVLLLLIGKGLDFGSTLVCSGYDE